MRNAHKQAITNVKCYTHQKYMIYIYDIYDIILDVIVIMTHLCVQLTKFKVIFRIKGWLDYRVEIEKGEAYVLSFTQFLLGDTLNELDEGRCFHRMIVPHLYTEKTINKKKEEIFERERKERKERENKNRKWYGIVG